MPYRRLNGKGAYAMLAPSIVKEIRRLLVNSDFSQEKFHE